MLKNNQLLMKANIFSIRQQSFLLNNNTGNTYVTYLKYVFELNDIIFAEICRIKLYYPIHDISS